MIDKLVEYLDDLAFAGFTAMFVAVTLGYFTPAPGVSPDNLLAILAALLITIRIIGNARSYALLKHLLNSSRYVDFPGEKLDEFFATARDLLAQVEVYKEQLEEVPGGSDDTA